jgi:hypothetical protein
MNMATMQIDQMKAELLEAASKFVIDFEPYFTAQGFKAVYRYEYGLIIVSPKGTFWRIEGSKTDKTVSVITYVVCVGVVSRHTVDDAIKCVTNGQGLDSIGNTWSRDSWDRLFERMKEREAR